MSFSAAVTSKKPQRVMFQVSIVLTLLGIVYTAPSPAAAAPQAADSTVVPGDPAGNLVHECHWKPGQERYLGIGIDGSPKNYYPGGCHTVKVQAKPGESNSTSCPSAVCRPHLKHSLQFNLRSGPVTVESIEACLLDTSPCEGCSVRNYTLTKFAGTPYEVPVQVGICGGQCEQDGQTCVATRFQNEIVRGPNGPHIVKTIGRSSCQSSCYKVDHFEGRLVQTLRRGRVRLTKKKFNVGRCMGSCKEQKLPKSECLWWSSVFNSCLYPTANFHCVPEKQSIKVVEYTGSTGQKESISIIQYCKCLSG